MKHLFHKGTKSSRIASSKKKGDPDTKRPWPARGARTSPSGCYPFSIAGGTVEWKEWNSSNVGCGANIVVVVFVRIRTVIFEACVADANEQRFVWMSDSSVFEFID